MKTKFLKILATLILCFVVSCWLDAAVRSDYKMSVLPTTLSRYISIQIVTIILLGFWVTLWQWVRVCDYSEKYANEPGRQLCFLATVVGGSAFLVSHLTSKYLEYQEVILSVALLYVLILVFCGWKYLTCITVSPKQIVLQGGKIFYPGQQFRIVLFDGVETTKRGEENSVRVSGEIILDQTVWTFCSWVRQVMDFEAMRRLEVRQIDWEEQRIEMERLVREKICSSQAPLDYEILRSLQKEGWEVSIGFSTHLFIESLCLSRQVL